MKYIIIDLRKNTALHGVGLITLLFDSEAEAVNIGGQLFSNPTDFIVVGITIKQPTPIANF